MNRRLRGELRMHSEVAQCSLFLPEARLPIFKTFSVMSNLVPMKAFLKSKGSKRLSFPPKFRYVLDQLRGYDVCEIELDDLHIRLTFNLGKTKSFTTVKKSILELVELPSLVAKCCKTWKNGLAKFANLYTFVLREEKVATFDTILAEKW